MVCLFFEWDMRRVRKKQCEHKWTIIALYRQQRIQMTNGYIAVCSAKAICQTCKAGKMVNGVKVYFLPNGRRRTFFNGKELHVKK